MTSFYVRHAWQMIITENTQNLAWGSPYVSNIHIYVLLLPGQNKTLLFL